MQETDARAHWEDAYKHTRRNLRVRRERFQAFGIEPSCLILDYGCGDGLDLYCMRSLGYDRTIGIDYSEELLRAITGVPVVSGDCEVTPFRDASFDVVFVNSVLHHLDPDRALVEIRRILKPGGLLCVVEPRTGWPRRILDLVTLSGLGAVLPSHQIRNRRTALRLEFREYSSWLRRAPRFVDDLRQHGFDLVFRRDSLLSMILACRRTEMPTSP